MIFACKQVIFVFIIFSEHTESQFSLLLVQRMVVCPHRKLAIICNTRSLTKKGFWRVLCYFCISVVLWQADNFIQRSQPRKSLNGSCAYEEQMHFKKLLTGMKCFDLKMENSKAGRIWAIWVWLTLWFLWAVIP